MKLSDKDIKFKSIIAQTMEICVINPKELTSMCNCSQGGVLKPEKTKEFAETIYNVWPTADGSIRLIDRTMIDIMGQWLKMFAEDVYEPRPSGIPVENKACDFLLRNDNIYYLYCCDLPMEADPNVALIQSTDYADVFYIEEKIKSVTWLDNDQPLVYEQKDDQVTIYTQPFCYGRNLVVRVAKIET